MKNNRQNEIKSNRITLLVKEFKKKSHLNYLNELKENKFFNSTHIYVFLATLYVLYLLANIIFKQDQNITFIQSFCGSIVIYYFLTIYLKRNTAKKREQHLEEEVEVLKKILKKQKIKINNSNIEQLEKIFNAKLKKGFDVIDKSASVSIFLSFLLFWGTNYIQIENKINYSNSEITSALVIIGILYIFLLYIIRNFYLIVRSKKYYYDELVEILPYLLLVK